VSFDSALLDIICCPTTRLPLEVMPQSRLEQLNRLIAEGQIRRRDDSPVTAPLEQALMTRDGKRAYPVRDGVPVLLEDECIPLDLLGS
jgi:uncharacterized protein